MIHDMSSILLSSGIRLHALQTGTVQIHPDQVEGRGHGLRRRVATLLQREWTEPLPILAWAIEHPEGLIVVDTGDTARTGEPGYLPRLHPYYRRAVRLHVTPEQEIGPQLLARGLDPRAARWLVLTHLHTDHAGGLHHFDGVPTLVDGRELRAASGAPGRLRGYLPHRWPRGFAATATAIDWREEEAGPFPRSMPLTTAGNVVLLPTPGHSPGHVSVLVRDGARQLLLAGDVAYSERLLLAGAIDGVAPDDRLARETGARLRELAASAPTTILPTHDPESVRRLEAFAGAHAGGAALTENGAS
jgi:glyoxylase-like metal-dependent hydrolase (beta-lactamase superfamily II)